MGEGLNIMKSHGCIFSSFFSHASVVQVLFVCLRIKVLQGHLRILFGLTHLFPMHPFSTPYPLKTSENRKFF